MSISHSGGWSAAAAADDDDDVSNLFYVWDVGLWGCAHTYL
jgi:hypothetical protein